MITEDQLEQLCLDWFKAIGYVCDYDIAPDGDSPEHSDYLCEALGVSSGGLADLEAIALAVASKKKAANGDQDGHILQQIKKSPVNKIAVSIHGADQLLAARIEQRLACFQLEKLVFFDSQSVGCWNNPAAVEDVP